MTPSESTSHSNPSAMPPAAPAAAPSPYSSPSSSSHGAGPEVALLFIGVSLALGALCRQLLKKTRVPYTVALLLIGVALGALDHETDLGILGESVKMWAAIDPDLVLFVFLPALLFESSFAFEFHQVKRCLVQMFLLAVPGVGISTALLGLTAKFILPYSWNWPTSLLLGGLLSATDPVAVVALLRDLGASKKLSTMIEGESLMNDGTAIVVFQLFLRITLGSVFSAWDVTVFLCRVFFGGIALGLAFAIVTYLWLRTVFNDYIIEITLTLTASYMAFFVANDVTEMSGVLSDMTLGIFFAIFAKAMFTGESETSMHIFWEMLAYIANTLIFVLSGVVIAEQVLEQSSMISGSDWGYLIVLYIFVQISRAVVVGVLYPGLAVSGYGINWKEACVLIWSGLRGAVALTLALIVSHEKASDKISAVTQARFIFLTGGVVFLTLIINGSTTQFLLALLGMNKTSDVKKRIREYARHEMIQQAIKTFEDINDDEELGPADWSTVQSFLHCLEASKKERHGLLHMFEEGGRVRPHVDSHHHHHHQAHLDDHQPHGQSQRSGVEGQVNDDSGADGGSREGGSNMLGGGVSVSASAAVVDGRRRRKKRIRFQSTKKVARRKASVLREQQLEDTRQRLLNGVQASCWSMLEEGRITQSAAILLMQAVAEATDIAAQQQQLGLWKCLHPHIKIPRYLRQLHHFSSRYLTRVLPTRLLNLFTVDRIELAASMAAAFLRANRHARRQLRSFLGSTSIADAVILESEAEDIPVKKFLEDVRLNFPEVLSIIRTKQVTFGVLSGLSSYVTNLQRSGLLDDKESTHLHDSVEADLQRLQRHPPFSVMLPAGEVLQRQPLIGALPMDVRQLLCSPMREMSKHSADVIFQQGDQPDGVWLVASGIVKVTSPELEAGHALHPLFAHGTCIGLYECLSNLPRIATATADSSLHAFFIDKQRIDIALQGASDAVENFFWKESAMELARLLLPNIFGEISPVDLRRRFSDESHLLIVGAGEAVEVGLNQVGLLLQGAVRPKSEGEGVDSDGRGVQSAVVRGGEESERNKMDNPAFIDNENASLERETPTADIIKSPAVLDFQLPPADDAAHGSLYHGASAPRLVAPTTFQATSSCRVLLIQMPTLTAADTEPTNSSLRFTSVPPIEGETHTGLLTWQGSDGEDGEVGVEGGGDRDDELADVEAAGVQKFGEGEGDGGRIGGVVAKGEGGRSGVEQSERRPLLRAGEDAREEEMAERAMQLSVFGTNDVRITPKAGSAFESISTRTGSSGVLLPSLLDSHMRFGSGPLRPVVGQSVRGGDGEGSSRGGRGRARGRGRSGLMLRRPQSLAELLPQKKPVEVADGSKQRGRGSEGNLHDASKRGGGSGQENGEWVQRRQESEESEGEDEVVVRIDSPSQL